MLNLTDDLKDVGRGKATQTTMTLYPYGECESVCNKYK